jgi:hypothetical protein
MRATCRPGQVVIVDCARYATNFLYNQRRPSWRRQTCPCTSRPVMLRLGMMTRRRCQVVGLAVRRFNPNVRMLMVVDLIDAMLPHLARAARCRPHPQRASRRPSSAFTIVAPAATARNNADARNSVLDPRDTRIIANRAATVVNEVCVLTCEIIIWSTLRYFCPPCFRGIGDQEVGWVERSETHHPTPRVMANDGFRCALPILRPELRLVV